MNTRPVAAGRAPASLAAAADARLLRAVADGDEDACRSLVDGFGPAVFGLARSLCRDRGVAEDIAQRTFERVWRHAGSFDSSRGSAAAWILTITRRLAIDELRRRPVTPLAPDDMGPLLAPAASDTERAGLRAGEREAVSRALSELPEAQRRAVVLATLGGRSASEVADLEGVPLGTAKTRIRLGLRRLRDTLDGEVVDHG